MVATTPRSTPYIPWYRRWELPALLPGALLAFVMQWSVIQSIANANWADGLALLVNVALPALLVGIIFARLPWLPGWLAHILSAALGIAWSIQQIGPLLVHQITQEFNAPLAERLIAWNDRAAEVLIRVMIWGRVLAAGGRGEDIVLFVVALALLCWACAYMTGWFLFRLGWTWWAVIINATMILVNYTYAAPKPNTLFFTFLVAALLLVVHQNITHKQHLWRSALIEYPEFLPGRFLVAATLFCSLIVLFTSLLPGSVSSAQVARVWGVVSSPLTAVREGWEDAFSTINAPPGTSGNNFATRSVRVGGARSIGDSIVMRVRSSKYDYWRAVTFDKYTGQGWFNTVSERARVARNTITAIDARTPVEPGVTIPRIDNHGRTLVTETITLVQPRGDNLIILGGEFASSSLPVLIQHGFMEGTAGQPLPNFDETNAIYSQLALQEAQTYTVTGLISNIDEQSLRRAGTDYPRWVTEHYLSLPDTVTERTKTLAREIVTKAAATTPYDQALAIQTYLRRFPYNERRLAPPENRDWVDYFLFDGRTGYCDDFATSMVVMLRSLNIPARWVQGYAGGTLNPQENAYIVRESIAHSWPEIYMPGYGWQRFEPTPASYAIPPDRPHQPNTLDPPTTPDQNTTLPGFNNRARELIDLEEELNGSQQDLEASRRALAARQQTERNRQLLIAGTSLVALLVAALLLLRSLRRDLQGLTPAAAIYARLGRIASWSGLSQNAHITPYEYAHDLSRTIPNQRERVERIVGAYVAERYSTSTPEPIQNLESDWRPLRRSLLIRLLTNLGGRATPPSDTRSRPRRR